MLCWAWSRPVHQSPCGTACQGYIVIKTGNSHSTVIFSSQLLFGRVTFFELQFLRDRLHKTWRKLPDLPTRTFWEPVIRKHKLSGTQAEAGCCSDHGLAAGFLPYACGLLNRMVSLWISMPYVSVLIHKGEGKDKTSATGDADGFVSQNTEFIYPGQRTVRLWGPSIKKE